MSRAGLIAVRSSQIRLQLRLQVRRIERREDLPGMDRVALLNVDRVGGLGERALHSDVLERRDYAGQLLRWIDGTERGDRGLHERDLRRGRRLMSAAACG